MDEPATDIEHAVLDVPEPEAGARAFYEAMRRRRSVRAFSARPVSRETIEWIVRTAGSAPSGANKQPWRFVCVSDPEVRRRLREAAEERERAFYEAAAPARWLRDLAPLGTDADKRFLTQAPWLIAVMRLTRTEDGGPVYYGRESVGIACGLLLAAVHHAGLAALTYTPQPMDFVAETLGCPPHDKPYLLVPVGHPAGDCRVPALRREPLVAIARFV